jgi:Protein of unknown function (DUF3667)
MSHKTRKPTPYCLNCHYPTAEFDNFCSSCGQKATDGKVSLHDLLHEFVHSIAHLDGKIFTTLRHLLVPGKLTVAFFEGHHKRYAHPIQLFIVLCGLSLIFSSKSFKKIESSFNRGGLQRDTTEAKSMLFELDSIAKIQYQTNPILFDSVHKLLIIRYNALIKKADFYNIPNVAFNSTHLALKDNTQDVEQLNTYLKTKKDTVNNYRIEQGIGIFQQRIAFLLKDSIRLRQKLEQEFKKTPKQIDSLVKKGMAYGLGAFLVSGKSKSFSVDKINEVLLYPDTVTSESLNFSFEDALHTEYIIAQNTIKRDSTRLTVGSKIKIDDRDILNMTYSEVIKKYNITGFYNTIKTRFVYNFSKDSQGIIHTFLTKKMYIYVFLIVPLAYFMRFLYRRQHRYYVEHIVFLMHYFCLSFLLEAPEFFLNMDEGWIYYTKWFFEFLIILPLALKRYYQQGWIKTYVKAILIIVGLYTMTILIFVIGFLLSLAFT